MIRGLVFRQKEIYANRVWICSQNGKVYEPSSYEEVICNLGTHKRKTIGGSIFMPELENNVSNRTFEELFKPNIQFEIPFFQRGYAWEKKHWDQLFNDINEQIIPEIESFEKIDGAEHFFGPIVVLEKRNSDLSLRKFLVIDGQQRITTIYLILAIIRNKLEEKTHQSQKASEYCNILKHFIENEVDVKNNDDYHKLKVFSSKGDRLPTYLLIFKSNNPQSPFLTVDQQLYVPDKNNIDQFKKYLEKKLSKDFDDVPSLWRLSQILIKCLKIVWIGLDEEKDDPQAIFESLNDRGMPLAASELICNFLFKPLISSTTNYEEYHNNYWLFASRNIDSDGDFEDYLRILFSIDEKKVIGKGRRIYVHFKNKNKQLDVEKAKSYLDEIKSGVEIYNQIANPIKNKNINKDISDILIKIKSTRMDASNPFLLSLLKANAIGSIDDVSTKIILNETLVLLVRRKMCEMPTQKYDIIFPNMLARIINEPDKGRAFKSRIIDDGYFVSDQDFEYALINKTLYRKRDLPFTRMVLQEIDRSMQVYGQLPDYSTLETVEHILPQTIDDDWKNYLLDDSKSIDLKLYTNSLGNLCLLSQPANSHAGQDPFESKKRDYPDVSALTRDIKDRNVKWNISEIIKRSEDLSKHVLKIWAWSE